MKDQKIVLKDECYAIQGAIFEVYREMGCGFLEAVYQECLSIEFGLRNISFSAQTALPLAYKGTSLKQKYVPDFVCFRQVIVELKAAKVISPEHKAQLINYLRATKMHVGLLVNFGAHPKATVERFVL